jgi:hypothetical protein
MYQEKPRATSESIAQSGAAKAARASLRLKVPCIQSLCSSNPPSLSLRNHGPPHPAQLTSNRTLPLLSLAS